MTYSGSLKEMLPLKNIPVLIPLLLDDLLWEKCVDLYAAVDKVLIPLLLDDLLWELKKTYNKLF